MRCVAFVLAFCLSAPAFAYDTGGFSCDDIGKMAEAFVIQRDDGTSAPVALAMFTRMVARNRQEGIIAAKVAGQIWSPQWRHLTPDGAYLSYKADCEAQQ